MDGTTAAGTTGTAASTTATAAATSTGELPVQYLYKFSRYKFDVSN